jgi:toxin-antitoxin system PIN domain toxin
LILVDANLLLYAYNLDSVYHSAARHWLEKILSGAQPLHLAWATLLAFMRIGTNSRIFPHPLAASEAVSIISEWLERPTVSILDPTEGHWKILADLVTKTQAHGPLVTDAHLAALAIEHGATLYTTDQDFSRFPGLKLLNPLKP